MDRNLSARSRDHFHATWCTWPPIGWFIQQCVPDLAGKLRHIDICNQPEELGEYDVEGWQANDTCILEADDASALGVRIEHLIESGVAARWLAEFEELKASPEGEDLRDYEGSVEALRRFANFAKKSNGFILS